MYKEVSRQLLAFIEKSPSCYHVIRNIEERLQKKGFIALQEGEKWKVSEGNSYYVTRNSSSLVAFRLPEGAGNFQIIASHSDSPTFKIKEHPEMETEKQYVKLNVEKYGGMICSTWMDRPLSVAGRIFVSENDKIREKLVDIDKNLLMIPNLAIHMDREQNNGHSYNPQTDMLPVYGAASGKKSFLSMVAEYAGVKEEDILGTDLFLYNRMPGTFWGAEEEYIAGPKLDDLQCAFGALEGFLAAEGGKSIQVYAVFDNEEAGSQTKQGAASGFLKDTLHRIAVHLGKSEEEELCMLAESFMISADNAHAVHPNHPEKADPTNRPYLNGGIVIKYHANQKYTTDGRSAAVIKLLCKKADVLVQAFTNRSDMQGGSTLGNISSSQVAVDTVDIGLPQWAMHSSWETAGAKDTEYLVGLSKVFYESLLLKKK